MVLHQSPLWRNEVKPSGFIMKWNVLLSYPSLCGWVLLAARAGSLIHWMFRGVQWTLKSEQVEGRVLCCAHAGTEQVYVFSPHSQEDDRYKKMESLGFLQDFWKKICTPQQSLKYRRQTLQRSQQKSPSKIQNTAQHWESGKNILTYLGGEKARGEPPRLQPREGKLCWRKSPPLGIPVTSSGLCTSLKNNPDRFSEDIRLQ